MTYKVKYYNTWSVFLKHSNSDFHAIWKDYKVLQP